MFDVVNAQCRGVCVRHGPKIVDASTRCICSIVEARCRCVCVRHGLSVVDASTRCLCSS